MILLAVARCIAPSFVKRTSGKQLFPAPTSLWRRGDKSKDGYTGQWFLVIAGYGVPSSLWLPPIPRSSQTWLDSVYKLREMYSLL